MKRQRQKCQNCTTFLKSVRLGAGHARRLVNACQNDDDKNPPPLFESPCCVLLQSIFALLLPFPGTVFPFCPLFPAGDIAR